PTILRIKATRNLLPNIANRPRGSCGRERTARFRSLAFALEFRKEEHAPTRCALDFVVMWPAPDPVHRVGRRFLGWLFPKADQEARFPASRSGRGLQTDT